MGKVSNILHHGSSGRSSDMNSVLVVKVNQLGDTVIDLPLIEAVVNKVASERVYVITTPIADGPY